MNLEKSVSVYKAINAVQSDLAREGITKDRKNAQQGYSFRGIDDVFNAVSPLLAKHGLCILPRFIERECVERQTKNGGALFYVTVTAEFDFVAATDGSKHTVRSYGEAMDSADKATNKAMSAAYKYACMQAFAIPTEGDNDADAHTPQPAPRPAPSRPAPVSTAVISAEDLAELRDLCRSTKTSEAEFAKWLGQADLSELRVDQLPRAKRALEAKAAKMQAEAA